MEKVEPQSTPRNNRTINVPFNQDGYPNFVKDASEYRKQLDFIIKEMPELFPNDIVEKGYKMKDINKSKKLSISIRRINVDGVFYTIRPSFSMPYMVGFVSDTEKALFARKFNVPYWGLAYIFGKNPMYWYRIEQSIGRNSIVGTTINQPENLPNHVAADEKHTRRLGDKAYVATTVGDGCVLGASISKSAGEKDLLQSYEVFKTEAQYLNTEYKPETVNTDGWKATQNAWKTLFPAIVILCCFLHVYIKIRDRAKKRFYIIFQEAATRLWNCYESVNKRTFSQRVRRLYEWAIKNDVDSVILNPIKKLHENVKAYSMAYDYPGAHRTSNMIDRLMQRMDVHLFNTQYFHGSQASAELSIRGWALIHNFAPSNPHTVKKYNGLSSPAERINQKKYHDNWLQNLLCSASLRGYRRPPLNPL